MANTLVNVNSLQESNVFVLFHFGKAEPDLQHAIEMEEDEHITFLQTVYVDKGICHMLIRTNLKQVMKVEDEEVPEPDEDESTNIDFNLEDTGEAMVGFSGTRGKFINGLSLLKIARADQIKYEKKRGSRKKAPKLNHSMRLSSISSGSVGDFSKPKNFVQLKTKGQKEKLA